MKKINHQEPEILKCILKSFTCTERKPFIEELQNINFCNYVIRPISYILDHMISTKDNSRNKEILKRIISLFTGISPENSGLSRMFSSLTNILKKEDNKLKFNRKKQILDFYDKLFDSYEEKKRIDIDNIQSTAIYHIVNGLIDILRNKELGEKTKKEAMNLLSKKNNTNIILIRKKIFKNEIQKIQNKIDEIKDAGDIYNNERKQLEDSKKKLEQWHEYIHQLIIERKKRHKPAKKEKKDTKEVQKVSKIKNKKNKTIKEK